MLVSRLAPRAFRTALPRLVHTEARIKELGLELPAMPVPLASYTTCVRSGSHLYLAGHVPFTPDMKGLIKPGKCGKDYTTEEGAEIAKFIGLECISTIKANIGDLCVVLICAQIGPDDARNSSEPPPRARRHSDRVKQVVKVVGLVNCPDDYGEQSLVLNGFSNLMAEVFGPERGKHARSAIGTNSLPFQMPVEIECIVEVED